MPPPQLHSILLEQVSSHDISSAIKKLKPKTSFGHDGISTKIMKETIENILEPITHVINQSISKGVVPDLMKVAKVIPIHKSYDRCLLKNNRPVSLLPAFSKLLEKIMYSKLMEFLLSNNILHRHKYGFGPKHSTIHPIIHLLNHCAKSTSKQDPEYTLSILCDLSKAFDVITHDILLNKTNSYGIRGVAGDWFRS